MGPWKKYHPRRHFSIDTIFTLWHNEITIRDTATPKSHPDRMEIKMAARKINWNSLQNANETGVLVASFVGTDAKMEFPLGSIPDSIKPFLILNGLKQKIADSAAGSDSPAEDFAATWKQLTADGGKWTDRAEGGTGPKLGLLLDAFIRLRERKGKPISIEDGRAKLAAMRDAYESKPGNKKGSFRASLMSNDEFRAIYEEIENERAAATPATPAVAIDSLLD